MPLIRIETQPGLSKDLAKRIEEAAAEIVSAETGKPVKYIMVTFAQGLMFMSGEHGEATLVQVSSIGGLNREVNGRIAEGLTDLLADLLDISPERVYITFTDVPGENWAWNGRTFR